MFLNQIYLSEIELKRLEAEFYQPFFIAAKQKVKGIPLYNFSIKVIHPAEIKRIYSSTGIRILLAQNVRDNFFDWANANYMHESVKSFISQNELQYGDVTITRSGANFGQTSVITTEANGSLFGCADLLILKPGKLSGPLLSTYFNSKLGKLLLLRGKYGAAQPHLAPSYIYHIPFPEYLLLISDEIESLVKKSRELQYLSTSFYSQAQSLFEKELGMDKIEFISNNHFSSSLSSSFHYNRFDSEYYQPKYNQIKKIISNYKYGFESLLQNITCIDPNINPKLLPNTLFNYIELSNIKGSLGVVDGATQLLGSRTPSRAQRQVLSGDVIASSVVGSVDKSALISDNENNYLASTGFLHLRSSYYSPPYLILLMQSKILTEQLKQEATGGILSAVSNLRLKHIIIPKIHPALRAEISSLVTKSHTAYRESKQLLSSAIKQVEDLIESESAKN